MKAIPYLMLLMIIGAALSKIIFRNTNAAMIFLYAFTFVMGMDLGAYMIYNYVLDFIKKEERGDMGV